MRTLKKSIVTVITALLLLSLIGVSTAFAVVGETGDDGDFDWEETDTDAVTITAYTGPGGAITIPATLSGRTVVAIAADAFGGTFNDVSYNELITGVEIPAGVTAIEDNTFNGFTALESVTFANGTGMTTIGEGAFAGSGIKSFDVPAGVTAIGPNAFNLCKSLAAVTLEAKGLTTIDAGTFSGTALTSIKIPANITTIGDEAFSGCASLTSLTFAPESSISEIGMKAFYDTKLVSLTLPEGIGSIGDSAFSATSVATLTKVVIYSPDVGIGTGAFKKNSSLVIYAPRGSTADTYCLEYPDRIFFVALETVVGDTSIKSVVPSGSNKITITWAAADRATGYQVQRKGVTGEFTDLATTAEGVLSYTDTGLTMGVTYNYRVSGIITDGGDTYYGNYSEPVTATPLPGAPNSVYAASAGYNSINVWWTPVQSASGYEIWRANDKIDNVYSLVKTLPITMTIRKVQPNTYKFTYLTSGRQYFYKIRAYVYAVNPVTGARTKCYGAYSGITMARPVLTAVTDLNAVQLSLKSIRLTWKSVAGKSRYEIWRKGPGDTQFVKYPYTAYYNYFTNDINIVVDSEYSYKVRAYRTSTTYGDPGENGKIYGGFSNEASVNLDENKVTGVVAKRYNNYRINVTWKGISGVAGYQIQFAEAKEELVDDDFPEPVDRKTYRYFYHTKLADGVTIYYRVRAYEKTTDLDTYPDGKKYGVWSDIKSAKT